MGTNCVLFADLFLYSYEADFMQGLLKKNEKKLTRSFDFTFLCIDDVLSLHNSRFGDFVDRIYPIELEIKDTTVQIGILHTLTHTSKLTVCSNIPAAPAYGVYISQFIRIPELVVPFRISLIKGCC